MEAFASFQITRPLICPVVKPHTVCTYDAERKSRGMHDWDYLFMLLSVRSRSLGFSDSSMLPATASPESAPTWTPAFQSAPRQLNGGESYHCQKMDLDTVCHCYVC